jgi:hypothetical protein
LIEFPDRFSHNEAALNTPSRIDPADAPQERPFVG